MAPIIVKKRLRVGEDTPREEPLDVFQIQRRAEELADLEPKLAHVDAFSILLSVMEYIKSRRHSGSLSTTDLDDAAARFCNKQYMRGGHNDWCLMAARFMISSQHKSLNDRGLTTFSSRMRFLHDTDVATITQDETFKNANCKTQRLSDAALAEVIRRKVRISGAFMEFVARNAEALDAVVDYNKDFQFSLRGFTTLNGKYLMKKLPTRKERIAGRAAKKVPSLIVESPQDMYMRMAVQLLGLMGNSAPGLRKPAEETLAEVIRMYRYFSDGLVSASSPIMINSGRSNPQMSACNLMRVLEDSREGKNKALAQMAMLSKFAGGIGIDDSILRAHGSLISSTGTLSSGIPGFAKEAETLATGGSQMGVRSAAQKHSVFAAHKDVLLVLKLRLKDTNASITTPQLHTCLSWPDLFWKRYMADGYWTMFDPAEFPDVAQGLITGQAWVDAYLAAEAAVDAQLVENYERVPASQVFDALCKSIVETGEPYSLFVGNCNKWTNQSNLGVTTQTNLCTEIVQVVLPADKVLQELYGLEPVVDRPMTLEEREARQWISVCNLMALVVPKFVYPDGTINTALLEEVLALVVRAGNSAIDNGWLPLEPATRCNLATRPLGIGVQGFTDALLKAGMGYYSPTNEANNARVRDFNRRWFCAQYFLALKASAEEARLAGKPYPAYHVNGGCPLSHGVTQPELHEMPVDEIRAVCAAVGVDMDAVKAKIAAHGVYNSMLIALMPTATSAAILDNSASIEPIEYLQYRHTSDAGEFVLRNKQFIEECMREGVWDRNSAAIISILDRPGVVSVHDIPDDIVPPHIKDKYVTATDIPQSYRLLLAAERQPFVCQAQSQNLSFTYDPDSPESAKDMKVKIARAHLYASQYLKSLYYTKCQPETLAANLRPSTNVATPQTESRHTAPAPQGAATPAESGSTGTPAPPAGPPASAVSEAVARRFAAMMESECQGCSV